MNLSYGILLSIMSVISSEFNYSSMLEDRRGYNAIEVSELAVLEDIALQYYYTTAAKKAISVLTEITDNSYFIPPAYGGGSTFEFRGQMLEELSDAGTLQIYPNPASSFVNIELNYSRSTNIPAQFIVRDAQGRTVYEQTINTSVQVFTVNTTDWAQGTYVYNLRSKEKLINTGKIEIIR